MAQQKRRTSSSGRKSSSSGRKPSSSNRKSASAPASTFMDYFHAFSKTRFFVPVASVVVIALLILVDMLLAWNDYDRFFKIMGFELLIVGIIWVIGLVLSFGESTPSSGN